MTKIKKSSCQALLKMASDWEKEGKVQSAIETYETVIETDSESEEAEKAKVALLEIARKYKEQGKDHSAFHLYKKLAFSKFTTGIGPEWKKEITDHNEPK